MPTETATAEKSYGQILKSAVLVGGSSLANIAVGVARAKAMAILIGPSGVGLVGLYSSISDVAVTVAGMGVNSSGVRQIAAAAGSGDTQSIARITLALRQISVLLGMIGAALLIVFSPGVSELTFGKREYAPTVCLLAGAVFFRLVSAGQAALIQGMRRISDLAKMSVWSAFLGSAITIVIVFVLREKAIVPSLVCGAAIGAVVSWRYSRRIGVCTPAKSTYDMNQLAPLLKLGFAFMGASLMTMGSAYIIRIIILRQVGLEAAGLYQSAWTLGGLYLGFILQAMGADFYPRLTASAHDNAACNRLVNEQAFIGLLLGAPGVLATLTLAPLIITVFYTARFQAAVELLRWLCLGSILQVISWPMGFIILAKGRQNIFLSSDIAWTVVYITLAWVCVRTFGLNGAGIAFWGSYVFHLFLTYSIVSRVSGFRWSRENKRVGNAFLAAIGLVFLIFHFSPPAVAVFVGLCCTLGSGIYSARRLARIGLLEHIPKPMRLALARIRPARSLAA